MKEKNNQQESVKIKGPELKFYFPIVAAGKFAQEGDIKGVKESLKRACQGWGIQESMIGDCLGYFMENPEASLKYFLGVYQTKKDSAEFSTLLEPIQGDLEKELKEDYQFFTDKIKGMTFGKIKKMYRNLEETLGEVKKGEIELDNDAIRRMQMDVSLYGGLINCIECKEKSEVGKIYSSIEGPVLKESIKELANNIKGLKTYQSANNSDYTSVKQKAA